MKLNRLGIAGFRGINEKIKLDTNGKSLLLVGENGVGKTSVLQAIEWALLGELAYLEGDEFKREDALVNLFDKEGLAVVEMEIEDEKGLCLKLTRERKRLTKTRGRSSINLDVNGELYKAKYADAKLAELLGISPDQYNTTIHLHQEVVRELVEGNEESRNKAINRILGIDQLSDFSETLTKQLHSSSTASRALRGAQKIVNELSLQRKTTSSNVTAEENALEKIKAKLTEKRVDVEQPFKEADSLISEIVQVMMETAQYLKTQKVVSRISKLETGHEKIEENLDEIKEIKRELSPVIEKKITSAKNETVELQLLEKQRKSYLDQLEGLKFRSKEEIDQELNMTDSQVSESEKELSAFQKKQDKMKELQDDSKRLSNRIEETSKEIESVVSTFGNEDTIQEKQRLLHKQEADLKQDKERLGIYNNLLDLASKYVEATEAASCPVCDSTIQYKSILSSIQKKISTEVAEHMRRLDQELEEVEPKKEQLGESLKKIAQLRSDLKDYNKKLDGTKKKYLEIADLKTTEPFLQIIENQISELQKKISESRQKIDSLRSYLNELKIAKSVLENLTSAESKLCTLLSFSGNSERLSEAVQEHLKTIEAEVEKLGKENQKLDDISKKVGILEDITAFLGRSTLLISQRNSLNEIDGKLLKQQDKLRQINNLIEALTDMRDAVNSTKMESLESILSNIHDDLNEYYSKMIGHPLFVRLRLVPEERGGKHLYRIVAENRDRTYQTYVRTRFSQAQRNLVAISLFLAMAKNSPINTIILDDPSQSLDIEHKKRFVEVLHLLMDKAHVILATQDEDFANQMLRHVTREKLKAYRFSGWSESGPSIDEIRSPS